MSKQLDGTELGHNPLIRHALTWSVHAPCSDQALNSCHTTVEIVCWQRSFWQTDVDSLKGF
eukprot:4181897-Amphidinium_carterae.1